MSRLLRSLRWNVPPSSLDKLPLAAAIVMVEHVNLKPALRSDQRGEKTDRSGAGDEERFRRPAARAFTDALGMVPRLGDDTGRFDQHAVHAERRVDLDQKVGLDTEEIRAVAVALLDAALGVAAVAAHVPLADRAVRTWHRIGPPHDADDQIAWLEAAVGRRFLHLAERLVPDHQPLLPRRRPAIGAGNDLAIGAADAKCQHPHQYRTVRHRGFRDVLNLCRIGDARRDG